ncbi:hypothetical protein ACIGD1_34775 [Streptomyces sp. NPDC085612]|uniref:hypothetical protein n=1 Tax=Streptomyces sp. NPDC085612 TaxID=3365732 RepID=UPI0037D1E920
MFETVTLDIATADFPSETELATVQAPELARLIEGGVTSLAALLGKPSEKVRAQLGKAAGIKDFASADIEDLREAARTLRVRLNAPSVRTAPKPPRMQRPTGMGQLPVPRTVKQAAIAMSCGLCADPIKAGEIIGRTRDPKNSRLHKAMGWLCQHCLYERREKPRRRDVLLRMFHHLFANSAVDLNAHECAVLRTWLLEDPDIEKTPSWQGDPLTTTVVRLQTSQQEEKATTWIAVPTARTIIHVLHKCAAVPAPAEAELLTAIVQHLHEWDTNPQGIERRRHGSGPAFHAQVLQTTACPSVLSERGGPFDLHHAPPPVTEKETADADGA